MRPESATGRYAQSLEIGEMVSLLMRGPLIL